MSLHSLTFLITCILLLSTLTSLSAGGIQKLPNSSVKKFQASVAPYDTLLVSARHPNCGAICYTVDLAMQHVAQQVKIAVATVEVNDIIMNGYRRTFKLAGFPDGPQENVPLFLIFKAGYPEIYQGPADFQEMITYLKDLADQVYTSARNLVNMEQKHSILEDMWHTTVIIHNTNYNSMFLMRTGHVLKKDGVVLYFCRTPKVVRSLGLKKEGDFLISHPLQKRVQGNISSFKNFRQFVKFIRSNLNEHLRAVTGQNAVRIFRAYEKVIVAFVDDVKAEVSFLSKLKQVAETNANPNVAFVYTEVKKMAPYLMQIGVGTADTPILLKLDTKSSTRSVFDNRRFDIQDAAQLNKWVEDQLQDTPTGEMNIAMSQDEPEDNDTRALKVLTNKNWNRMVKEKPGRVTFVVFTRPNCPHCTNIQAALEQLAEAYAGQDSVLVGKYDTSLNDLPAGITVKGLPTIQIHRNCGDEQKLVQYSHSDERTFESLKQFLEENKCQSSTDRHEEL